MKNVFNGDTDNVLGNIQTKQGLILSDQKMLAGKIKVDIEFETKDLQRKEAERHPLRKADASAFFCVFWEFFLPGGTYGKAAAEQENIFIYMGYYLVYNCYYDEGKITVI